MIDEPLLNYACLSVFKLTKSLVLLSLGIKLQSLCDDIYCNIPNENYLIKINKKI